VSPPTRAAAAAAGTESALNVSLGPGASNPCGEFIDINAAAQTLVTSIITDVIQTARVGRPTITFVNMIIRSDPAALASYERCRVAACSQAPAQQQAAIARCSHQVIGEFMSPALLPALLPAFVYFATNSSAIRSEDVETIDLVALFLTKHTTTSVTLTGHADTRGDAALNLRLGRARAESIQTALLARGVAAGQITSVSSVGEATPRGATAPTLWRDRSVVIAP
jgi:outer membrane protein OmpA-like peptidoglycan-associated protein